MLKKDKILFINSNSSNELKFFISDGEYLIKKNIKIDYSDADNILKKINEFLIKNKIDIKKDVGGIIINSGPGINMCFRIGIVIVNTLGYVLNIPVYGVLSNEFDSDEEFIKIGTNKISRIRKFKPITPVYNKV